jgi:hypothetical protein
VVFLIQLQSSAIAQSVGQSLWLTAWLSAAHLIGFTLVMSSGLMWNLRAAGVLLGDRSLRSVGRPTTRILVIGLAISLLTGFMLFAPRASTAGASGAFQLKMSLLVLAAAYQLAYTRHATRITSGEVGRGFAAAVGLVLWISLALTACWFILFE